MPSGVNAIDALAYKSWNPSPGTPLTLTYSFLSAPPARASATDVQGFEPMTAAQQAGTRAALATWSAVANVTFVETGADGKLLLGVNDQGSISGAYAYYPNPAGSSAVYLNDKSYNTYFTPGSYGAYVLIHELGHALGLKHPGDYNAGGGGTPGPYLPAETDNGDYTLMSYNSGNSLGLNGKYQVTPMLYDVQAMQYLYGANTHYRTGDDVYTFGNAAAPSCIWDAGGINTFDFSACTASTVIDLNDGAFSETAAGLRNVSIAYGVDVRRAIAGKGGGTIVGNDLGDTITGGAGADLVHGGSGDDSIAGGAGNDGLRGGAGNDTLQGDDGNDALYAEGGSDTLDGGAGTDTAYLAGAAGDWQVARPSAADTVLTDAAGAVVTLRGVEFIDFAGTTLALAELAPASAGSGNDVLRGTAGNDTLDGLAGDDTMTGLGGDDTYVAGSIGDVAIEEDGGGIDTVRVTFAKGLYVLGAHVENGIVTGSGAVALTGNEAANRLTGGAGANTLEGMDGNDSLDGGAGNDSLAGGAGDDTLAGGTGRDTLAGGAGDDRYVVDVAGDIVTERENDGHDRVDTALAAYTLAQHVEDLAGMLAGRAYRFTGNGLDNVIDGNSGNDVLAGGLGNDTLRGAAGRDSLAGGDGDDHLEGGTGADTLDGGAGVDTAVFAQALDGYTRTRPNATDLRLLDAVSGEAVVVRNVESFVFGGVAYTLADLRLGLVSVGDDVLTGTAGADTIDGLAGSDTMEGLAGNDTYVVDAASDTIVETAGGGTDTVRIAIAKAGFQYVLADEVENAAIASRVGGAVTGNGAANALTGSAAANTLAGAAGDDTLDGGAGNDSLQGGEGADMLVGGAGSDVLEGGTGDDTYVVDSAGDRVIETADGGNDTVRTALARWTMAEGVERLEYTGRSAFGGTGNALDNWIGGGIGADRLLGGEGNDTLAGGAGKDTLAGGAGNDTFVLRFDAGSAMVSDFAAGSDRVLVDVALLGLGNGDLVLDGAVTIAAPGGFGPEAELVIVSGVTGTLTAAKAAAAIGSADAAYTAGQTALFAVDNGTTTVLYRFVSAAADALVSAGELAQIAQLTGVAHTGVPDYGLTAA